MATSNEFRRRRITTGLIQNEAADEDENSTLSMGVLRMSARSYANMYAIAAKKTSRWCEVEEH